MKKEILYFVILFVTISINLSAKNNKEKLDFGTIKNSNYSNKYFGFSIKIPNKWMIQDNKTKKELMKLGKDMLGKQDKDLKKMLDISDLRTVNLLTVFKYPIGTPLKFNPSIIVMAEKNHALFGVKTGKQYLENIKKILTMGKMGYQFKKEITTKSFNGVKFDILEADIDQMGIQLKQQYFAVILKDYILGIVITYNSPEDFKILNQTINSIHFKK